MNIEIFIRYELVHDIISVLIFFFFETKGLVLKLNHGLSKLFIVRKFFHRLWIPLFVCEPLLFVVFECLLRAESRCLSLLSHHLLYWIFTAAAQTLIRRYCWRFNRAFFLNRLQHHLQLSGLRFGLRSEVEQLVRFKQHFGFLLISIIIIMLIAQT